jgi:mRNA interferase MazF
VARTSNQKGDAGRLVVTISASAVVFADIGTSLETVLAARITTTDRHAHLPTLVALTSADPMVGHVVVDDLVQLYRDELTAPLGALAPATMTLISQALTIALP